MSYNTELQSNNTDLQTILATINALPEAGSGGGATVETCTVNIVVYSLEEDYLDSTKFVYMDETANIAVTSVSSLNYEVDEDPFGNVFYTLNDNLIVKKNSLFYHDMGFASASGEVELRYNDTAFITGDCTLITN